MVSYSIYCISCSKSDKKYIGFTSRSLNDRLDEHFRDSTKKDRPFYKAIQKYGKDSFSIELLYQSNDLEYTLNTMEEFYIQQYKNSGHILYNVQSGGRGYKNNPNKKPVCIYDENLNLIRTFNSISECASHFGLKSYRITELCKNARNGKSSQYKGFWVAEENVTPVKKDTSYLASQNQRTAKMKIGVKRPNHTKFMTENNPNKDYIHYNFVHKTGEIFYGTRIDLALAFPNHNINTSELGMMIRGKYKTHRGWKLLTDTV